MRTFIIISCVMVLSACVPKTNYEYRPVAGYSSGTSANQARASCESRANRARNNARREFTQQRDAGRTTYETANCTGYGNRINCTGTSRKVHGGLVAGLADGLSKGLRGNTAYDNEMKSCMADKGFGKYKVSAGEQHPKRTLGLMDENPVPSNKGVAVNSGLPQEMMFWQSIKDSKDPASFQAYLDQYPNGHFASLARLKLKGSNSAGATPPVTPPKSNLPNQCDVLAANPADPKHVGLGVRMREFDAQGGLDACAKAVSEFPNEPRFLYQLGRVHNKLENYDEAFRYYKLAKNKNYIAADINLGAAYYRGRGVDQDYVKAMSLLKKAFYAGAKRAGSLIGLMYVKGRGVNKDYGEAASWWHKAAKAGSESSQYGLGMLYGKGWGVEKDRDRAIYWLQKSANQGFQKAQNMLSKLNR
jgi:tetratricopeptide (TPR) repeat protein